MKRVNEKGSWKKAKELGKQLKTVGKELQEIEKTRVEAYKKLVSLSLELYGAIPLYDCLLPDSPLFPTRLRYHLTAYSKKLGMDGIKDILVPETLIKEFSETVDESVKWALKFENEKAN